MSGFRPKVVIPEGDHIVQVVDVSMATMGNTPFLRVTVEFLDLMGVQSSVLLSPTEPSWKNYLLGWGLPLTLTRSEDACYYSLGNNPSMWRLIGRCYEVTTTQPHNRLHLRSLEPCNSLVRS